MSIERDPDASPTSDAAAEHMRGPRIGATLAGASGRPLAIRGVLRPVIALGEGGLRGQALHFAVGEKGPDGRLTPVDLHARNPVEIERVDLTAAQHAFEAIQPAAEGARPPLFFLPLSWSTVRNPRARRRLMQLAAGAQLKLRNIVMCEITGIERGTPPSSLREVVGALQPIFRGVHAATQGDRQGLKDITDCGFTGVSIEARLLGQEEATVLRNVLTLQTVGANVLVHAVRSMTSLGAMRSAGVSWASLELVPGAPESAALAEHAQDGPARAP